MFRLRKLDTNEFWAHKGYWISGDQAAEWDYWTLDNVEAAKQAKVEVAVSTGLTVDQIEIVPQHNDEVPELPPSH